MLQIKATTDNKKVRALILCAGLGIRLGLKKTPKCMVKVNKKPVLEHIINHLNKHGITEIVVNIHSHYDKIFKYFGTRLLYLYEPTLLGEQGSEDLLKGWLGDNYIVQNGDTITNVDITKMTANPCSIVFTPNIYGGVKFVKRFSSSYDIWNGDGAYFYDCGTKSGLAKTRRLLK